VSAPALVNFREKKAVLLVFFDIFCPFSLLLIGNFTLRIYFTNLALSIGNFLPQKV